MKLSAHLSPELLKSRSWLPCGSRRMHMTIGHLRCLQRSTGQHQVLTDSSASLLVEVICGTRLKHHPWHAGADGLQLIHEHIPLRLQHT